MTKKKELNGSVGLLAGAMKRVFEESMMSVHDAVKEDMDGMEDRLSDRIDTTNKNVQAQFSQQEKKIGKLLKVKAQ